MKCQIINETKNNELKEFYKDIQKYFKKTLKYLALEAKELSLIIVDQQRILEINRDFRNKDKITDVISFACLEWGDDDEYLGDIFICIDKVFEQALLYGHSVKREFCFLFVHGLLHCLGYDHQNDEQEKIMFNLQEIILGDLK